MLIWSRWAFRLSVKNGILIALLRLSGSVIDGTGGVKMEVFEKMSKEEIMKRNIALNMDRRKRLNTSG